MTLPVRALWHYVVQAVPDLLHFFFHNVLGSVGDKLVGTAFDKFLKLVQTRWTNCQRYSIFLPYLWPLKDRMLGVWIAMLVVNFLLASLCKLYMQVVIADIITNIHNKLSFSKYPC
jgi:hypothetical protein